jgi:hypothetical protein
MGLDKIKRHVVFDRINRTDVVTVGNINRTDRIRKSYGHIRDDAGRHKRTYRIKQDQKW